MSQHIVVTCDITNIGLLTLHTPLLWSPSRDSLGRTGSLVQRDSLSTSGGFETNALVTAIQGVTKVERGRLIAPVFSMHVKWSHPRECVLCCRGEEGAAEAPY